MPKSIDEYFHNLLRLSFLFIHNLNLNDELMHVLTFDTMRLHCNIYSLCFLLLILKFSSPNL